ncbi:STAS domain-containing protein [Yinghuangia sp. KLBMP8922]|uniref:STAS domain-containing protein n=2 Tax=Yinghuangia soli TaxID=2908204 RepID=A0AA41Q0I3_9ACTN|nr:STAS domain-containing protein [Yinghuangia soli]MCF2529248.1 STAS domain-containing protein [Yinghuangia soli]
MLNILCRIRPRTLRPGGLRLVSTDPLVLRMLVATRLDGRFPLHRTLADALLASTPPAAWPSPGTVPWDPR